MADGASEALLAGRWAQLLVKQFVNAEPRTRLWPTIETAIDAWPATRSNYIKARERQGKPIAWYEEPGLERGAYATILACRFRGPARDKNETAGRYNAWAVGDSCFLQVRDDALLSSFPKSRSEDFGYSPELVPSRPADPEVIRRHVRVRRGLWRRGDSVYLVTDAIAHWFFEQAESGKHPWRSLAQLDSTSGSTSFSDWIEDLHADHVIHNDDCTVVRIELD